MQGPVAEGNEVPIALAVDSYIFNDISRRALPADITE
jgi:hypothetical protein